LRAPLGSCKPPRPRRRSSLPRLARNWRMAHRRPRLPHLLSFQVPPSRHLRHRLPFENHPYRPNYSIVAGCEQGCNTPIPGCVAICVALAVADVGLGGGGYGPACENPYRNPWAMCQVIPDYFDYELCCMRACGEDAVCQAACSAAYIPPPVPPSPTPGPGPVCK
jgi:hypothetical protein